MMLRYCRVDGPSGAPGTGPSLTGAVYVAATERGVCAVAPTSVAESDFVRMLRRRHGGVPQRVAAEDMPAAVAQTLRANDVSSGERATLPLDLSTATEFQRQVLSEVASIPAGETRTYAEVAAAVGRPGAARAVGGVMARNPVPFLVPCHRVVASDGSLGGYGYGLAAKRALLASEGWVSPAA